MDTKPTQKNKRTTTSQELISNGASATLESHNQTPRKVRLVTDLVKGKSVPAALAALQFLSKRAAAPVAKLIKSAAASASAEGGSASGGKEKFENLIVKNITVESAGMLKKYMPRAFGRASLIRRRKSRITLELGNQKSEIRKKNSPTSDFRTP
ncbi:MAG: 50S ribosomal protein L22 [Parcubacteria group bacterium GW2011_GWA1_54_9]|nr:MAG: 50S ribosomal protein L22 [Parcubacteria group bacterium GW2011_GWA1_54_9]KKW42154.1 MAG: 50S ribosomal protein L22 [Parcubacteria group bacterium GW2011_GWB1_55_9]